MKRIRNLAILNGISFCLHAVTSFLTQVKLINSKNIGEISDQHPSLFTPAAVTFLVWSLIYTALLAFNIYHIRMAYKHDHTHPANKEVEKIGSLFTVNNLATTLWLIAWVNEWLLPSVILIVIQLLSLMIIHSRLKIHNAHESLASKVFTQFPLSIYLGWISIATIANISTWLKAEGWSGWGISEINWTITMIAIAVVVTLGVINRKKDVAFGLVVIWGLYGILLKRSSTDPEDYQPIIMVIWGGMAILGLACLFGLTRNLRRR